jgi:hypothetical protein
MIIKNINILKLFVNNLYNISTLKMGCGNTKVISNNSFTIYLTNLQKMINKEDIQICLVSKELCKIVKKLTLIEYIYSSAKQEFKNLFDGKKPISNTCIFVLFFIQGGSHVEKRMLTYNEAYYFKPYEEMEETSVGNILEKLYIIDVTDSLFTINDLAPKIDKISEILNSVMVKGNLINQGNTDKVLNTEPEEKIEYDQLDEEPEVTEGEKIEINKELNSEQTQQILEKLEKEKIISFSIRNNHFRKLSYFKSIIDQLIKCQTLQTFSFSDNFNTTGFDEGWKLIFKILKENSGIRTINLSMSFLYDKFLKELLNDALKGKRIHHLDLAANFITYSGCKVLAPWLRKNKYIKVLNLHQNTMNEFKKEGCELILKSLKNHKLIRSLDFSHMILTGFGQSMSEFIKTCGTLEILKIRNTRMNLDDFKFLSEVISTNESIKELSIGENNTGNDKSLNYIATIIENNKNITNIHLDKMGIGKKNYHIIFDAIDKNDIIQIYEFNDNPKLRPILILPRFINKRNLKSLGLVCSDNSKRNQDDLKELEDFVKEREDVQIKI